MKRHRHECSDGMCGGCPRCGVPLEPDEVDAENEAADAEARAAEDAADERRDECQD